MQYKADINAVNEHGNVPLHYACFWGQDQVAEVSTQTPSPMMNGKQTEHGTINPFCQPYCLTFTELCTASVFMLVCDWPPEQFSFQDLVANGALVSICNKYGEMPVDKAKAPLRELLRGSLPTPSLSLAPPCISSLHSTIKAKIILLL